MHACSRAASKLRDGALRTCMQPPSRGCACLIAATRCNPSRKQTKEEASGPTSSCTIDAVAYRDRRQQTDTRFRMTGCAALCILVANVVHGTGVQEPGTEDTRRGEGIVSKWANTHVHLPWSRGIEAKTMRQQKRHQVSVIPELAGFLCLLGLRHFGGKVGGGVRLPACSPAASIRRSLLHFCGGMARHRPRGRDMLVLRE